MQIPGLYCLKAFLIQIKPKKRYNGKTLGKDRDIAQLIKHILVYTQNKLQDQW